MNRIHRVIWNAIKGCYVAANEATGTNQARGKVAVAVLATAMAVGVSANAATVENGVLTAEEGKSSVVLHNNVMYEGTYSGLGQTSITPENVSDMQEDARISGIAEGIANVYVGQSRNLTVVGSNLDIKANLIGYSNGNPSGNGFIQIGDKEAAKTTGSFGTISMGLPNLDSTLGENSDASQNQTLTIENAEISIAKLRLAQQAAVDSDAKVDVTTLQSEAVDKTSGIVNYGEVSIDAVETEKKGDYFNNIPGTIENHGKLTIGTTENGFVRLVNEAEATADIDSFVIHTGEKVTTDMDSINRGTLNVADKFVINGASIWGSSTPIIGIFRNEGTFTVGTAEKAASAITINGEMYNSGENAKANFYGDVTVADTNPDDQYQTVFSNTDGATLTISGDLELDSGTFINENATLTVGGMFGAAGDIANKGTIITSDAGQQLYITGTFTNASENASIEDFYVVVAGDSTLNLAAGSADLTELSISYGTAYIGQGVTTETVNLGDVTVWNERSMHVAGGATTGNLTVEEKAVIDEAIYGSEETGTGKLVATGIVTNKGQIRLNELDAASYTDTVGATATFNKLTLAGGTVIGSLNANELTLGDGSNEALLTITGTAEENDRGNVRIGNSAYIAKNASVVIGGADGIKASLKVVGESGTEAVDGILTIAGTVEAAKNGTLYAEGLTLDGGALGVTYSSAQTDFLASTSAGGTINLSQGGKLTVAGGSTAGITFNFNGVGTEVNFTEEGKFFENATINLNDKNWELTGEGGDGFGVNTVNINDGSTVSYTDNAVLKNNTTITLNEGGKIEANKIAFEDRYAGGLTLAGGTLTTTLDQIFSEVNADEYIEGTNVETGEIEQIPVSGIQSVGAVKDELAGEHGIKYESGAFEFTDNGWTVNAVNSASSMLQSAFDSFEYSDSTLIFSGTQDDESGAFGVEDANKLNSNIVLSGTILAAGSQNLTFGESSETSTGAVVTVPVTGFQAIADATSVTVTDGHHLYLTGFENDTGSAALLTGTQDGEIHITENGKLTLGLDGHQTGGSVSIIQANTGTVEVSQGGTFSVDALQALGNSAVTVDQNGTLNVDQFTDSAETQTTVNGSFNVAQALTVNGKFTNTGIVTTDSLASFADLTNSGRVETAAAFNGTNVVNTGVIDSEAAAFFDNLTNSGTVTGTEIAVGDDSAYGSLQNQTNGILETSGDVDLQLAGENANAGTIKGQNVTVTLADGASFANNNKIEATGTATFDSVVNSGNINAVAVNVGSDTKAGTLQNIVNASITASESVDLQLSGENANAGQITASGVSISLETDAVFTNSGTIKATAENHAIEVHGANASVNSFVNSGKLESAIVSVSGTAFETSSEIAASESFGIYSGSLSVTDKGSIVTATFTAEDSTVDNKGVIKAETFELENGASVNNSGKLSVTDLKLDAGSVIMQSETGVVDVQNLTVTDTSFDLDSGTWVIGSETGIKFVDDSGEVQPGTINVKSGKEYVTAAADVDNVVYDVTKTLTFGEEAGLADKLGIADATGILVVDKGIEIGATGAIRVGVAIETASARAPQDANFTVAADSVTIFTGNAFGADGSEAGILAGADNLSATIDKDAQAVLTGIQQSGQYKLIEGFDLSDNLDAEGNWIGGWTGENGKYVNVDNGSDLEWKTEVSYDKETNTIVADTVAADVRSVYNFATPDIANAALSSSADAAKGADVTFMQAVINNKDLNVAQTERIVNSVTQIAASLGTAANFLSDATSLMDTVETRTGLLSDAGKESGLWVRVEGGKYKMDGLEIAGGQDAGYDTNTYGVTFGADGLVTDGLRIGAAFSYLIGSADADGDVLSGTNDYDTYGLQAYAAYDVNDTMRVSGEIGWFHSSAELAQSISFANVNKAEADVDTDAFTFGIRGDWRFDVNGFAIVPHVGLRGIYMMNDEFTTTIDGKDAFKNDQDNTFTMQIPVGVSVEKAFATASGWNVVPSADVTVTPQFGDTEYDTTVTGIGTGVSQAVTADMAGNVLGRVAFGVKAENGASSFGAYYGFTAGDAGRQDHAFNLSFSYRF